MGCKIDRKTRGRATQEILLLRITMPLIFPSGWTSPRTIIQAYNEENVAVRLARYFASRCKARENERGEWGSVLLLVARLSIFLAFSVSRNISPALTLLLSRECYAFSRSIGGVLHLAFTFTTVSAVRPSSLVVVVVVVARTRNIWDRITLR